ncbi:MAG: MFS transporter [Dehalococcoidales bacterium]|jgi:sugar phosphate permease|nr:MFS transporter [Dehalococcoidales bacterium]
MSSDKTLGLTATPDRKPRYFYGWNIVIASFLSHLSYAEHFSSMLGFFFKPLQTEFGWSRSAIAAVQTVARVTEALTSPIVGPIVDRHGPRVLMPIGAVIVGLAMLAVTQIEAVWHFYLLRGVLVAVGFALMGNLVSGVAINNWFIQKRGRALAIARLGNNLSNIIFVPVTVFVIAASGWRTMFVIFAVVTWLVVLIPSTILMRRRPEDMGLLPDGIDPGKADQESFSTRITPQLEPVWTRREVLKTGSFWLLTIALGINSMAFQGINISLAPYIQDLGYAETVLASVMTFRAIFQAASLPIMGFLAERAHLTTVRVIPFVIQGIAVYLLLSAENPFYLWVAVSLYGFGISGITIIQEVIWANYFGRLSLGMVRSLAFLTAFTLGAAGPIAMNAVFDILGSYHPAFMVIIGLFIVSALIMTVVRPPTAPRYVIADEITPSAYKAVQD